MQERTVLRGFQFFSRDGEQIFCMHVCGKGLVVVVERRVRNKVIHIYFLKNKYQVTAMCQALFQLQDVKVNKIDLLTREKGLYGPCVLWRQRGRILIENKYVKYIACQIKNIIRQEEWYGVCMCTVCFNFRGQFYLQAWLDQQKDLVISSTCLISPSPA